MIDLRAFRKTYDELEAVKGLTLHIPRGEVYGFVGPNGAGKTTTIRFLATLLDPTSGTATINGYDVVRDVRDVRRSIGFMPDAFGVYNGMRVREFVDFFACAYGIKSGRRKRLIDEVLTLVELYEKRDEPVNALSRGMKQRLCLAKTLVHDPPVLILDEPASGLDPRARLEMKELLKELKGLGKTILISSHILSELADCCDSVAIMERGELVASGSIQELLRSMEETRTVEVQVLERVREAERWLGGERSVGELTVRGDRLCFELHDDDERLADLLDELQQRGHRPVWVEQKRADLESLFMQVTRGRVQ